MPYKDLEIRKLYAKNYMVNYRKKNHNKIREYENKRAKERWKIDKEYKQKKQKQSKTYHKLHSDEWWNKYGKKDYLKHKEKRIKHKIEYQKKKYQTDKKYREKVNKQNKLNWERHGEKYVENHKSYQKEYYQTEHGKLIRKKHYTERKRKLKFIPIIPNILDEKIVWHHIDNTNVIPIPEDIHLLYSTGHDTEKHRENLKPIIEQLYNIKF
jgi:hypothetical protein